MAIEKKSLSIKKVRFSVKNFKPTDEQNDQDTIKYEYYAIMEVHDDEFNQYVLKGYSFNYPEDDDTAMIDIESFKKRKDAEINANYIDIKLPHDKNKIKKRFLSSKLLKMNGVGKKTIENYVENYGEKIWHINDTEEINKIFFKKIEVYVTQKSNGNDDATKYINATYFFDKFFGMKLSKNKLDKIVDIVNFKEIIDHKDVYNILRIIEFLSHDDIKNIMSKDFLTEHDKHKIRYVNGLYNNKRKGLLKVDMAEDNYCKECMDELVKNQLIYKNESVNFYMLHSEYIIENNIVGNLERFIMCDIGEFNENLSSLNLYDGQEKSVRNAFNNKLSIITGFPGVGKTKTITSIAKICKKKERSIFLLAPTGKAVYKINKDIRVDKGINIYTIHRFIGLLSSYIYTYHHKIYQNHKIHDDGNDEKNNRLSKELYDDITNMQMVVIDEFSMVTNSLFNNFLNKMKEIYPIIENSPHFVIVGDVEQLPAIGPGNLLHELIDSKLFLVTKLEKQMRANKDLNIMIKDVRDGKIPTCSTAYELKYITNNNHLKKVLSETVLELLKTYTFDDIMVMTPTNQNIGYFSDDIRLKANKNYKGRDKNDKKNVSDFFVGDYVYFAMNLYKNVIDTENASGAAMCKKCDGSSCQDCFFVACTTDLYNGMTGKIISVDNNTYVVNFDDGTVAELSKKCLVYLKHSYVCTVHKYQGSENKISIILITNDNKNFVNFNMFYTAISRPSEKCIVIADKKAYMSLFNKKEERTSAISYFLKESNRLRELNKSIDLIESDDFVEVKPKKIRRKLKP